MFKYLRKKRTTLKDSKCSPAPQMLTLASEIDNGLWQKINWKRATKVVFNLQKRIYKASIEGNVKKAASLMRLLTRSTSNILISIRKVTQDNKGKRSPGVDGKVYLTPADRVKLAGDLITLTKQRWRGYKAKPARRKYVPKKNGKKRPLGLLIIKDRAIQAQYLNACDPYFEAKHDHDSYGFRKGYSAKDAIEKIFKQTYSIRKWIYEGDIKGCFDNLSFNIILERIKPFSTIKRMVNQWLKAGAIENKTFIESDKGTPQGGIISPLLANIALNGLEKFLKENIDAPKKVCDRIAVIRFADDFVVIHDSFDVIKQCPKLTEEWLAQRGVKLAKEKCRVVNTEQGFDFLGFNIRRFRKSKEAKRYKWNIKRAQERGNHKEYVTIIKPTDKAVKGIYGKVKECFDSNKATNQGKLIDAVNPKIRGWANYYKGSCASETFKKLDDLLWHKTWRWAVRRHRKKNKHWIAKRYFKTIGKNKWRFAEGTKVLAKAAETKIERHVKVQAGRSFYDGDTMYWAHRLSKGYGDITPFMAKMLRNQHGKCAYCNGVFKSDDVIEKHHVISKKEGGEDKYENMVAIHRHCHDQYHAIWEKHQDEKRKNSKKLATPYRVMSAIQAQIMGIFNKA